MDQDAAPIAVAATSMRPHNRRELILDAAAELFCRHGFRQVSMSDVAQAVDMRPSALYRHFPSKQRLLFECVRSEARPWRAIRTEPAASLEDLADRLAAAALVHRRLGILWQREARNLLPEDRAELRTELRAGALAIERAMAEAYPDLPHGHRELLSWCAWAVVHSASRHRSDLPAAQQRALVASMLTDVLSLPELGLPQGSYLPHGPEPLAEAPAVPPASRYEQLLAAAVELFARHGYSAVTIDAIGSAVGMTGPSVYHHFTDKRELLVTAVRRGAEWLGRDLLVASSGAADPRERLGRLIEAYARFALEQHDLIGVLITESRHLDVADGRWATRAQRDTVERLVSELVRGRPDVDRGSARIRVHAALSLVNDLVRTPRLRGRPRAREEVSAVVRVLLLANPTPPHRRESR